MTPPSGHADRCTICSSIAASVISPIEPDISLLERHVSGLVLNAPTSSYNIAPHPFKPGSEHLHASYSDVGRREPLEIDIPMSPDGVTSPIYQPTSPTYLPSETGQTVCNISSKRTLSGTSTPASRPATPTSRQPKRAAKSRIKVTGPGRQRIKSTIDTYKSYNRGRFRDFDVLYDRRPNKGRAGVGHTVTPQQGSSTVAATSSWSLPSQFPWSTGTTPSATVVQSD